VNQIISTAGSTNVVSGISVEWTIGEPITETGSNASMLLTQGFHQPNYQISAIYENFSEAIDFALFPNPVQDLLNLKTIRNNSEKTSYSYQIIDTNGKVLHSSDIQSQLEQLDFSQMSNSLYYISIFDAKKLKVKTFKIVKQ